MKNKEFWSVKNLAEGTESEEIEVKVYGEIVNMPCWDGDVSANSLKKEIEKYPNAKKISVRINSPGGDVFEAQAIYNILKNHQAEVTVYIDALAASAATLIASAGDKVVMYNNALFMMHNPWTWATGEAKDFVKKAELLGTIKDTLLNVYETHSSLSREEISAMMDEETWMTADEALENGFIHEVVPCKAKAEDVQEVQNFVREQVMGSYNKVPQDKFKNLYSSLKITKEPKIEEQEEVIEMKTVEELKEKFPEIYNSVKAEGKQEGITEGQTAERERIKAIDSLKGDTVILNKAKFEEIKDAGAVAIELNTKAEEEKLTLLNQISEREKLGGGTPPPNANDDKLNEIYNQINNRR